MRPFPLLVPVLLALLALGGCSQGGEGDAAKAAPAQEEPAVAVFATRAEKRMLSEPIIGTGTIAALRTTDIGPSIDGIIDEIYVRVGEGVTKGQPLFKTRTVEYDLRVRELRARVKLAAAERENARAELNRIEPLVPKGIVPPARLDKVRTSLDAAEASLGVAQAQLAQAEQQVKDAIVVAPYDAVVTARNIDEGRFMATRLGGGGMMGGPSGVVQLMHIDVVAAIVRVAEVYLPLVAVGMPARVKVDGIEAPIPSIVHVVNDLVDPASRSIEVRVGLENKGHAIKPGQFAMAELLPPEREVLTLERAAVLGFEAERFVFVAEGGRAKRIAVTARELDAERVEILTGLTGEETVLKGPLLSSLRDGAPVTVREVAAAGAEG